MRRRSCLLAAVALAVMLTSCADVTAPSGVCVPTRDAQGRIVRSDAARGQFMRLTGYPNGRTGYVVDHIVPLACCGVDEPSNMQWQSVEAAKEKDKTERAGCRS